MCILRMVILLFPFLSLSNPTVYKEVRVLFFRKVKTGAELREKKRRLVGQF